ISNFHIPILHFLFLYAKQKHQEAKRKHKIQIHSNTLARMKQAMNNHGNIPIGNFPLANSLDSGRGVILQTKDFSDAGQAMLAPVKNPCNRNGLDLSIKRREEDVVVQHTLLYNPTYKPIIVAKCYSDENKEIVCMMTQVSEHVKCLFL